MSIFKRRSSAVSVDDGADEDVAASVGDDDADSRADDASTPEGEPRDSAGASIFRQPEALSASRHGEIGVRRSEADFSFARKANLVPITLDEFPQAALWYPIVFVGPARLPCVVMGLREGQNLFVSASGGYERGAYVPAYLRQYPFLLGRGKEQDRAVLLIDRACDRVVEGGGQRLFENGEPTNYTKRAMAFLIDLRAQWARTEVFSKRLEAVSLLDEKELKIAARDQDGGVGEPKPMAKYLAADAARVRALEADQLKSLADDDLLMAIHAHLLSLGNWPKIVSRAVRGARG